MSQSPPNYMEGVPVKISEKYKPPPKVSLPQSVCQRLSADDSSYSYLDYDFSLEKKVLIKIDQWKKVRESERENRRQRKMRNEVERIRQNEEKEKQLLTAVSYPSAEELSSTSSSDVEGEINDDSANNKNIVTNENRSQNISQFSPSQQSFDTILMPTIVPGATYNPDKKFNTIKANSSSKINYSDFESDTSSPFDNIELKTINDLDILAQVLNVTQLHSNNDAVCNEKTPENNISENLENNIYQISPSTTNGNNITEPTTNIYSQCSSQLNSNNFYTQYNHRPNENYENMNGLMKNEYYYYNNLPTNQNYINYNNYHLNMNQMNLDLPKYPPTIMNQNEFHNVSVIHPINNYVGNVTQAKNKSKSVPDILKELNDEIRDSELRRIRNHSQTVEENEKISKCNKMNDKRNECFMKLSPSSQVLAKNISSMGFPLEIVSRITEKYGNDDKKIVEHLIPLSELLDLGFEELKISEALSKFDNNKEKALDFLIS